MITSSANHYSLEGVCSFLGIGTKHCLRVECDAQERVRLEELENALRGALDQGKEIGCIVLSGGSTLDHNIDPIAPIATLRDRLAIEYRLNYRPHIHVDSVNGWIWLLFRDHEFSADSLGLDPPAVEICERAREQMSHVGSADSFSADFHKTGLCPYASSFYVCRDASELRSLHSVELDRGRDERFGDAYAHRVTLENSRPAHGVASAWAVLATLGQDGMRRYVAMLMQTGLYLWREAETRYADHFEILNRHANFHATVILIRLMSARIGMEHLLRDRAIREEHNRRALAFFRWCDSERPGLAPLIGLVPQYRVERTGKAVAAFLLYPMSPYADRDVCDRMLVEIIESKRRFLRTLAFEPRPTTVPTELAPPR